MSGTEDWRPQRETKSQREWTPGQVKKPRSIRVTFASTVLVMEAVVLVFFGLAIVNLHRAEGTHAWVLWVSLVLAVVAILDCALLRRPLGYWSGWGIQIALLAGAFLEYTMVFVGVGFGLAWWYAVTKGAQLDRENAERHAAEERLRAQQG